MRSNDMRAVLLVLVASCGGSRTGPATPLEVGLPSLYAPLFVAGEKMFTGELVSSHHEMAGPVTQKTAGEVTCSISDVRSIRGGKTAELACDGIDLVNQISGTYVGTPQGLWKIDGSFEDGVTKLDPGQALVGAVPAKARNERKEAHADIDSGNAIIVEPHAGGWCVLVTSWGGDEGGWQLCLKEGAGIIGGHGFFAGGQTRDAYFGDVRRL